MGRRRVGRLVRRLSGSWTEIPWRESAVFDLKAGENGDKMTTNARKILTEDYQTQLQIVESKGDKFVARGEFGRCDVPTKNGRIYPLKIMEREIEKLRPAFKKGGVVGHLDHPASGNGGLTNASHVITDLYIKDGVVFGEAHILNNDRGRTIRELIERGYNVGLSSRGRGSTMPADSQQGEEVQEDFDLVTYDFVENPAMPTALPKFYTEDVDEDTEEENRELAEMFMREFPSVVESIRGEKTSGKALTEDEGSIESVDSETVERRIKEALVGLKEEVKREVMEEAEADPDIAGAKGVLAAIAEMLDAYRSEPSEDVARDAVKASELAVSEAEAKAEGLEKELLRAKCEAAIERKISGHAMTESIRKLIGKREFETLEEADEVVDTILSDLPADAVSRDEIGIREENAELKGKIALLEGKVDDLNSGLVRAKKLGERLDEQRIDEVSAANEKVAELEDLLERTKAEHEMAMDAKEEEIVEVKSKRSQLDAYKLEKVAGLANGRQLFGLLESVNDEAEVDKLVLEKGSVGVGDPMLEQMRQSIHQGKGSIGTKVRLEEDSDEKNRRKSSENSNPIYPGVMDFSNMARLAGYEEDVD